MENAATILMYALAGFVVFILVVGILQLLFAGSIIAIATWFVRKFLKTQAPAAAKPVVASEPATGPVSTETVTAVVPPAPEK